MAVATHRTQRAFFKNALSHRLLDKREEADLIMAVLDSREAWESQWKDDPFVVAARKAGKEVDWDEFWSIEQFAASTESRAPDLRKRWRNPPELNLLIVHNLRLCAAYVGRLRTTFTNSNLTEEDAFSEIVLGFCRGIYRFDRKYLGKIRLSTYITYWFRHSVQRAVCDTGHTIRIPAHRDGYALLISRAIARYRLQHGDSPDYAAIVDEFAHMTRARIARILARKLRRTPTETEVDQGVAKVRHIKEADVVRYFETLPFNPLSLDRTFPSEETCTLHDFTPSPQKNAEELTEQCELEMLKTALGTLTSIERDIIQRRFAMDASAPDSHDTNTHTFRTIANKHNLSSERIRQLQERAIRKLRLEMESMLGMKIPNPPSRDQ